MKALPLDDFTRHSGDVAVLSGSASGTSIWARRWPHEPAASQSGRGAGGKAVVQREGAVGRAGDGHAGRQLARYKSGERIAPHRPGAEMGGQMHGRAPAAGDRHQIAVDPLTAGAGLDIDTLHAKVAVDTRDDTGDQAGADVLRRLFHQRARGRPRLDDRFDDCAGAGDVADGQGRLVIVGEHHDPFAGRDGETIDVGADGAGQHHAGAVVVAEHQRPLDRRRRIAPRASP